MKSIILDLFGQYTPVMTDSYTSDGAFNGTVVASGAAGVDYPWIAGFVLFAICFYCVFRIVGRK